MFWKECLQQLQITVLCSCSKLFLWHTFKQKLYILSMYYKNLIEYCTFLFVGRLDHKGSTENFCNFTKLTYYIIFKVVFSYLFSLPTYIQNSCFCTLHCALWHSFYSIFRIWRILMTKFQCFAQLQTTYSVDEAGLKHATRALDAKFSF